MKIKILVLVFLAVFAVLGTLVALDVSGVSVTTTGYKPTGLWRTTLEPNGAGIHLLGDPVDTPGMPT